MNNYSSGLVAPKRRPARSQMSFSAYGSAVPPNRPPQATAYTSLSQALTPTSADSRAGHHGSSDPPLNDTHRFPAQMATDGRYAYQASQGPVHAPSYPPYAYASGPYQTAYATNPPRPVSRGDSPSSQSPQQPPSSQPSYNPPSAGYAHHPSYPPPGYATQPPWTTPSWQYTTYVPAAPQPAESSQYQHHDARQEASQSSAVSTEQRGSPSPPTAEVRRDQRSPRPSEVTVPKGKARKVKESEIAAAPTSLPPAQPPPTLGLDFVKLIETYRLIIDSSNAILNDAPQVQMSPSAEKVERMLEAARFGVQALDSAAKRAAPDGLRDTQKSNAEDADTKALAPAADQAAEGQTCMGCNATSTPEWRRGPLGPRTLCNACGLVYAKLIKKRSRAREAGGSGGGNKKGVKAPRNDNGQLSSGSDNESYGSQDRRSEVGDHHGGTF